MLTEEDGATPLPGCQMLDGQVRLDPQARARLHYDSHDLAVLVAEDGFHYLHRSGRSLPVVAWDNGPDGLQEGMLRGRIAGRIGYFSADLRPAFAATFDFGWPFQGGVARVCNGCRRGTPDADGHTPMEGGDRFQIDRQGRRLP